MSERTQGESFEPSIEHFCGRSRLGCGRVCRPCLWAQPRYPIDRAALTAIFWMSSDDITAANNPVPAITKLQPSTVAANSGAFTLTVTGTGFVSNSVVNFNGNARTTTFASATQVTAAILASDVASAGTPSVTVTNPTPGGGTSNPLTFTITAANNPLPAI